MSSHEAIQSKESIRDPLHTRHTPRNLFAASHKILKLPLKALYREIERESLHTHQTEGKPE